LSGYYAISAGRTNYSVQSPSGNTVTMTRSGVKATLDYNSTNPPVDDGGVGASWEVDLSPVIITLTGTLTDSNGNPILDSSGNQQILIGQKCTAKLSGIPLALLPYTMYQWSVHGTTLQSWVVVADSSTQSHTTEVDGYGTATNSTLSWYWNDLGPKSTPETVTCTATVTPPAGQGEAFSVTATQKVTVYVPGWICTGTGGAVYINTEFGSGNGTDYYLYAGPAVDTTGRGMTWNATVSAPTGCTALGTGGLEMVQTEIPSPTYTSSAGVAYKRSNDGQQGLDSSYPYPFPFSAPSYASGDSPNFNLTSNSAVAAQLTYSFVDTLMYEPPNSTQYVPLATYSWSTSGGAQLTGAEKWDNYGTDPVGAVTPSGITPFTASNAFPSWAKNVGNGTSTWVAAK
jgi:hypothetical protein